MVSQEYTQVKTNQTAQLKPMFFILRNLYFSKTGFLKKKEKYLKKLSQQRKKEREKLSMRSSESEDFKDEVFNF